MLRILSKYAPNAAQATDWQSKLEAFSDSNEFPYTIYALAALDYDGNLWVKIGRSYDPVGRIGTYRYADHFKEFDIREIVGIGVIGWKTLDESIHSEKFIHAQLHGFRYDAREWFTNWDTGVSPDSFVNLIKFYWRALAFVGATAEIADGLIKLVAGHGGFPSDLVSYHRVSLPDPAAEPPSRMPISA